MNRLAFFLAVAVCMGTALQAEGEDTAMAAMRGFYEAQNIQPVNGRLNLKIVQAISDLKEDGAVAESLCEVYAMDAKTSMVVMRPKNDSPQLFLKTPAGSWLYKKGLRSPLRISAAFNVVGAANLADVLGLKLLADYRIQDDGGGALAPSGEPGPFVDLKAGASDLPYQSIRVRMDGATGLLAGLDLRGLNGKTIKTVEFSDYRRLNNGGVFPVWTIRDVLYGPKKASTRIRFESVQAQALSAALFQPTAQSMDRFLELVR